MSSRIFTVGVTAVVGLSIAALCSLTTPPSRSPTEDISREHMTLDISGRATLDIHGSARVTLPTHILSPDVRFGYHALPATSTMPNLFLLPNRTDHRLDIDGGNPGEDVIWEITVTPPAP